MQPASKRSQSTQVSEEFVRRQQAADPPKVAPRSRSTQGQQAADPPQVAPPDDLCKDELARLDTVVGLLEQLAKAGLPTLINTFYRSGGFTKYHQTFHTDESTVDFPRAGNWNLSLAGSLLCLQLRGNYNNEEAFGTFMEAFTVRNARKQPKPDWYNMYQRPVTLIDQMMATCTQATYDAMKWKINPAEFIHVIRVHEGAAAPRPGTAVSDLP